MRRQRWRLKLYRYLAGELAAEEQAMPHRPRLSTNRVLWCQVGRWVYCARVVKS